MEHARTATSDDLTRVVELMSALRAELAAHRGGSLWAVRDVEAEPEESTLAAALAQPETTLVVGTIDAVVVGYAVVTVEVLRDGAPLGRITELYVEPDARCVGVGEAISRLVIDRCRAAGCRGVDVVALPGHRATKNFLEEQGFAARAIVMHRQLDADP